MEAIKIRGSAATLIAEFDLISPCIIRLSTVLFFRGVARFIGRVSRDTVAASRGSRQSLFAPSRIFRSVR